MTQHLFDAHAKLDEAISFYRSGRHDLAEIATAEAEELMRQAEVESQTENR